MNNKNSLLSELLDNQPNFTQIAEELGTLGDRLDLIIERAELLTEDDSAGNMGALIQQLDVVMKQFEAAKKGLGLVNKLSPGPSRAKHSSRIMGNMNRIRAGVKRAEKALAAMTLAEAGTV